MKHSITFSFKEPKSMAFMFASLMTGYPGYPNDKFCDYVGFLLEDDAAKKIGLSSDLKNKLKYYLSSQKALDELRSDYIDIFDRGEVINSPHETEYGNDRTFRKTVELADLSGFYLAFGFELGQEEMIKEMADHISVELEFYALLLMKEQVLKTEKKDEGVEIVRSARKKFLNDHLGRFVGILSQRPGVLRHPFYSKTLAWCAKMVQEECDAFGIHPQEVTSPVTHPMADLQSYPTSFNTTFPRFID